MADVIQYKKFITVQEDENGEMFLEFPDDLLEIMDWKVGDHLVWTEINTATGGGFSVEKVSTHE